VQKRKPEFFILENLPRIRNFLFFSYNPEDPTFRVHYYDSKTDQMETKPVLRLEGYKIYQYVIDTVEVGLPQLRKRLYIVGMKEKYPWNFEKPKVARQRTLGPAIRNIPADDANHQKETLSEKDLELWKRLKYLERSSINKKVRKMGPKIPCKTIVSAAIRFFHWSEQRYLTPRECLRIQGFPDTYIACGSINQQLNTAGKAVSPRVIEYLAKAVYNNIILQQEKSKTAMLLGGLLHAHQ